MIYGAGRWKVDQCLGFKNAEVLMETTECIHGNERHDSIEEFTDLHYVAQKVTRLLNNQRKFS